MSSSVQLTPTEPVLVLPAAATSAGDFTPLGSRPGTALQCELVTDFARLEDLSEHWERLWQSSRSEIFQKFAWVRAFWKTLGSSLSLCSLVVHNGVDVVGILPLASDGSRIRFLAEGDYNDVLCEEQNAPAVLAIAMRELLNMRGYPATCFLHNLKADSRIARHLSSLPRQLKRNLVLTFAYPCPAIAVESDPETFVTAARKESLRRHENKLRRQGRLSFRHIESRREIHQHLSGFFRQQIARRALLGQNSHFQDPRERAFYGALVDEFNPRNELRFSVLELEGKPVAYHFGFQLHGKFIWYQTGFDLDLWQYSPGEVLTRKLLQYAYEAGLHEFDFTVGGELYKHRFANVTRKNLDLHVERQPVSIAAQFRRVTNRLTGEGRQIRERLKEQPRLYRLMKRTWLGAVEFVSQQRRLFFHSGMIQYSALALKSLVRNAILSKNETFVFSIDRHELAQAGKPPAFNPQLKPHAAGLSELALLSLERPDEFRWSDLHAWRKRLEGGDRVHVVELDGQLVYLAWTKQRPMLASLQKSEPREDRTNSPAVVIESFWSAPAFRESHQLLYVLQLLIQKVGSRGNHSTYYVTTHTGERQELETGGFRPCERIVQLRFLHVLRASWTVKA